MQTARVSLPLAGPPNEKWATTEDPGSESLCHLVTYTFLITLSLKPLPAPATDEERGARGSEVLT